MYVTHIIVIICSTPHFVSIYLIDFQLNTDFSSQFCVFLNVKSPSVTQRSVSQDNAFKKSKNLLPFCRKTISSYNSFTLIKNSFRFLRLRSLNSRLQYTIADGQMHAAVTP